jgi:antitoxin VapB
MALSIKTKEADRLARQVAALTGETITEAVTKALEERLARLKARPETEEEFVARSRAFINSIQHHFVRKGPVTPEEWLEAGGDEFDLSLK